MVSAEQDGAEHLPCTTGAEVFDKHYGISSDDDGTIQFIDSTSNQQPRNWIERKPAYTTKL